MMHSLEVPYAIQNQFNNSLNLNTYGAYPNFNNFNSPCSVMLDNNLDNNNNSKKDRKFFNAFEDNLLRNLVMRYGARNWILLASMMPGKTARQCRDRYMNYLAPGLTQEEWTEEEDELLQQLVIEIGPKWSLIAKKFPQRSPINVKNRWAHFLGKKFNLKNRSDLKISSCNGKTSISTEIESNNANINVTSGATTSLISSSNSDESDSDKIENMMTSISKMVTKQPQDLLMKKDSSIDVGCRSELNPMRLYSIKYLCSQD
ncbi:Myb-like DNA-binding domain containing protein [Tritrichomonas foetus]|uniref:Myb-like DNA-binding domain containing protein n=1 Tax=Tritrichomonas foetus TaxID=1144522 RepID=A0A1J4K0M3_9EUKA|nr:Myb-like DNA-binding domain containing protein [Tritrichomonas foetus]|eukprot:OHT03294.1 Myb-like DNA-binding domain containing protein [Tritrichomonas foetus]